MESMIDAMFSAYVEGAFDKFIPKYKLEEDEEKFEELWDKLNNELPIGEQNSNDVLRCSARYEYEKRAFRDALRLGLLLCAEVLPHE